jgi:long-subunit fatty acid transport protein
MKMKRICTCLILLFMLNESVFTGDTDQSPYFGVRTFSRNGLYFAGNDASASVLTNPAGLLKLAGASLDMAVYLRAGRQQFESPTQGLFKSFRSYDYSIAAGAYWRIAPGLSVALAYYPAADYKVSWPYALFLEKEGSAVTLAFDMYNDISVDALTPALAMQLGGVDVGVSANIYRIEQTMAFPLTNSQWYDNIGLAAYQFDEELDGWSFGITVGLGVDLSDRLRMGGVVRSGYGTDLSGRFASQMFTDLFSAEDRVNARSEFQMPWLGGLGVNYNLSENAALNLDVAYTLWRDIHDSYDFTLSNQDWQDGFAEVDTVTGLQGSKFRLSYENTLDIGVGFEYAPAQGMHYRAGYRFSQTPNSGVTYGLLFPGVDQHWLSFGMGYTAEKYVLDVVFAYAFGASKDVIRSENLYRNGQYKSNTLMPAVMLKYGL